MCCALSQLSVLYFREVLSKTSGVMEELQSSDKDKRAGLGDRNREQGVNLVDLSDRVHSEYRMTFILKVESGVDRKGKQSYWNREDKDQTDGDMY
jgi:hypothetical protein